MKINFIGVGLFKSGGMRAIYDYGNLLTDRGYDVAYYYPVKPYFYGIESYKLKIKMYYWNFKLYLKLKKDLPPFYHKFKVEKVPIINDYFIRDADILIATAWPTAYSVNELSGRKGKKVYYIQDYEIWNSDKDKVDLTYKLDMNRLTVSKYLRDLLKTKFNSESTTINNCPDYIVFNNTSRIIKNKKTISFIDHHLETKGVEDVLNVVERIKLKYPETKFICFSYRRFHKMPNYIEFIENPDDKKISEIYKASDIFVSGSHKEGFCMPPVEAMACKCAVVVTKVGAVPEYSVHMETALHVSPRNPDEMFKAVSYLMDNDLEIIRLGENGYRYVREKLNWDKSVDEFEEFIAKCV